MGQRIRKARLCSGLMKVEFAQILGVNVKTLREWESDKRKPSKRCLTVLEEYLRASLEVGVSFASSLQGHPDGGISA